MELFIIIVAIVAIIMYATKEERRVKRNVNKMINENWNTSADEFNKHHGGEYIKKK